MFPAMFAQTTSQRRSPFRCVPGVHRGERGERARGRAQRDAHARALRGHHDVEVPVGVEVGRADVVGAAHAGDGRRRAERAAPGAQRDEHARVDGGADHEVGDGVIVEEGRCASQASEGVGDRGFPGFRPGYGSFHRSGLRIPLGSIAFRIRSISVRNPGSIRRATSP